ncbi:TrmB family transcriptional regulator [Saliphagus sp. LR7]|uniref:TrmB family transcriptional regulator n=1 Tax=Saliphagus sp. LR7 TaxID=2282654 RepID=UPI000DF76D14|nr:TrmB family transcriptional regulator [Saliphagus sp. LR7]
METERLRAALEGAGLTGQQAEAYLTLLETGQSPVVDLARESSVSSSRIYDVVRGLEEMGFVETIERDRLFARPREPVDVLERLRSQSEMLADAAGEIEERWERPDPRESRISVLKHQESVLRGAGEAIAGAEVSVELAATPDQVRELRPEIEAAADRGVLSLLSVYDIGLEEVPIPEGVLEVRRNPIPGPFLAVVDRRYAFFSPNVHGDEPYGITIGDEILSFILHWFFLTSQWGGQESVHVNPDHPPTYVSIEGFVRDAAALLAEGATITLQTVGHDTETGELVSVEGELIGVSGHGLEDPTGALSYTDLAGHLALSIDDGERLYTVGGWGALVEEIEAQVIRVTGISPVLP